MSTGPENHIPEDRPPPPGDFRPELSPPGQYQPGHEGGSDYYGDYERSAARDMANMPGILLIAVGVFDALLALVLVMEVMQLKKMTLPQFETLIQTMRQRMPQMDSYFDKSTPEELKSQLTSTYTFWAAISMLAALLVMLGGARLRALRSYGLAVTAALIAMVPCISCTACCGFGEIVGVWAIVVLLNPEVRAAFR